MKQKMIKACAIITAFALLLTCVPQQAKAALAPAFKLCRSSLYENSAAKGIYTYTVKNLKKGYKVKWSVTGTGKQYIKFSKTSATVAKTTSSTKVTFASKSASVAGKKAVITAKVYTNKNKLLKTVKDTVALKVQATDITMDTSKIAIDLDSLPSGASYDFDTKLVPRNTTSTTFWSVEDASGKDYSSEITADGVFTPSKAGTYTIKVIAKNNATGASLATDIKTITVGTSLVSVSQIAANQFTASFNSSVKNTVKATDFSVRASAGTSTLIPKSVKFSADGKTATVTTHTNFKNSTVYTVTYSSFAKTINASVGVPKEVKILTTTAPANKATELEYALYDENGIDVKTAYTGNVSFDGDIPNGYITSDNKLFMTKEGKDTVLTITYTTLDGSKLTNTQKITCIPLTAEEASSHKFTITNTITEPDFKSSDFKSNTKISLDESGYAHFCAFDDNDTIINYDKISYTSSNDEILIVNSTGKMIPVKEGTVSVIVTAAQGKSEITYSFVVNVLGKRTLNDISLSSHSVTMSNSYEQDYVRYITVTGRDQYGNSIDLSGASYILQETSNKALPVTYDPSTQQISVRTGITATSGTYNYKFTITSGQKTLNTSFIVVVTTTPTTGAVGYVAEVSSPTFDMKVDETTKTNPMINVRLAKYINGVFVEYTDFTSATIQRNGLYYLNDLTQDTSKTEMPLSSNKNLEIAPLKLNFKKNAIGECTKAPTGTYTIVLKYYDNTGTARTSTSSLILKDTQAVPTITIKKLEAEHSVSNALALVNECLSVSDGIFESCTATGTTLTGDSISVAAGDKIHINTVTIKSIVNTATPSDGSMAKVYVSNRINVDRTLSNK